MILRKHLVQHHQEILFPGLTATEERRTILMDIEVFIISQCRADISLGFQCVQSLKKKDLSIEAISLSPESTTLSSSSDLNQHFVFL